ncbi:LANO_0H02366g1_1 [Lachancea nothofagi CBS 11611]|uniref:LANO_0H02366g1_1 n=1 Tax=Lachancea nothofagi CBS 11611 TaxID=1266666 RepID=A0A1G4KL39_9SACH|nr:LANO_0H02366g1_1 [Lachancea nothofagi CBS 11611]
MSRLRKFNRGVLDRINGGDDSDNEIPMHPMDVEEQEEYISNLELRNVCSNSKIVQLLSIAYMVCCGVFLSLVVKVKRLGGDASTHKRLLLFSINSVICSLITLRYEIMKDFSISRSLGVRITTQRINALNCMLLLLITWEVSEKVDKFGLRVLFHVPLVLFSLSVISKKWMSELEDEINSLRGLKYKFKNV